jgi:hypothetical protein
MREPLPGAGVLRGVSASRERRRLCGGFGIRSVVGGNAANPRAASRMQQACDVIAEQTVMVVRNHGFGPSSSPAVGQMRSLFGGGRGRGHSERRRGGRTPGEATGWPPVRQGVAQERATVAGPAEGRPRARWTVLVSSDTGSVGPRKTSEAQSATTERQGGSDEDPRVATWTGCDAIQRCASSGCRRAAKSRLMPGVSRLRDATRCHDL